MSFLPDEGYETRLQQAFKVLDEILNISMASCVNTYSCSATEQSWSTNLCMQHLLFLPETRYHATTWCPNRFIMVTVDMPAQAASCATPFWSLASTSLGSAIGTTLKASDSVWMPMTCNQDFRESKRGHNLGHKRSKSNTPVAQPEAHHHQPLRASPAAAAFYQKAPSSAAWRG